MIYDEYNDEVTMKHLEELKNKMELRTNSIANSLSNDDYNTIKMFYCLCDILLKKNVIEKEEYSKILRTLSGD